MAVTAAQQVASLTDVLAGRQGPEGIGELARNPLMHGVADLLATCLPTGQRPNAIHLQRTKYKPHRLAAYYDVRVGADVRQVAVRWTAEPSSRSPDSAAVESEAAMRDQLGPYARLAAETSDGRVAIQLFPADPRLPQLARVCQREYLLSLLSEMAAGRPSLSGESQVRAVRFRPGQRHVICIWSPPDGTDVAFVKLDRDDCGPRAVHFALRVGPVVAGRCPGAALVAPFGYSATDRAAIWRAVPGRRLSYLLAEPGATRLLWLVGRAVRTIHDTSPAVLGPADEVIDLLHAHRVADEVSATRRAGEHLDVLLPATGQHYQRLAMRVLESLDRLEPEDPALTHGDLKCDNIIATAEQVCLLDLDRAGVAEPAMDLGKIIADLRWSRGSAPTDAEALVAAFSAGYGPSDPARWRRARLLAVLFQLKLAARRTALHTPGWAEQMASQVTAATWRLHAEELAA